MNSTVEDLASLTEVENKIDVGKDNQLINPQSIIQSFNQSSIKQPNNQSANQTLNEINRSNIEGKTRSKRKRRGQGIKQRLSFVIYQY